MDNFKGLAKYEQKHYIIFLENDVFILKNIL